MLLHASWEDVVFLHFLVEPRELRRLLPDPLRLDLPLGEAWLSLVALRTRGPAPLPPRLLRGLPTYSQINVRTYVEHEGERGIFFLDQMVSSTTMAAAARLLGVHQRSAEVRVARAGETIDVRLDGERAALAARVRVAGPTVTAARDLIGAALLERYVGFDGSPPRRTAIEHAPWVIQKLDVESLETHDLLPSGARLAAAHFGTPRVVAVGIPHAVPGAVETGPFVAEPA